MSSANPILSLVVPVYFNEASLPETIPALLDVEKQIEDMGLEIVFVDDGSRDRSLDILLEWQERRPDIITVVKLSRNFGTVAADQAGMAAATGDCLAIVSADLQDPPSLLTEMVRSWKEGYKAVFAVREERHDPWLTTVFARLYYSLFRRFAVRDYPSGGCDMMLVDRQIVDELNRLGEKNTHLQILVHWLGHRTKYLPYVRQPRRHGKSGWTTAKKLKLAIDTFIGFSYSPIRFMAGVGMFSAFGAMIYGLVLLISYVFSGSPVRGFTALMTMVVFTSGIQMAMLGMLGEYLWRALDEARKRPAYVVDRIVWSDRGVGARGK